jgi:hypothetical protein
MEAPRQCMLAHVSTLNTHITHLKVADETLTSYQTMEGFCLWMEWWSLIQDIKAAHNRLSSLLINHALKRSSHQGKVIEHSIFILLKCDMIEPDYWQFINIERKLLLYAIMVMELAEIPMLCRTLEVLFAIMLPRIDP